MPCIAHKNTLRNKAVLPIRKGEPLLFFKNFKFAQKTEERKMKRVFAMVMAVVMAAVIFAGCSPAATTMLPTIPAAAIP